MQKFHFFTLVSLLALLLLSSCGTTKSTTTLGEKQPDRIESEPVVETPAPTTTPMQEEPIQMATVEDIMPINKKAKRVLLETSMGNMTIELFDKTPQHRDNFIKLADEAFFNDLLFHRVINGFMIQGGDPNSKNAAPNVPLGSGGPGYTVPAEFDEELIHVKGVLSAARQGDQVNPMKASSGSQFYVVQGKTETDQSLNSIEMRKGFKYTQQQRDVYKTLGGTPFLDGDYTVFGRVIEGLDVIDKIASVQTNRAIGDRPVEDVKMKITVLNKK